MKRLRDEAAPSPLLRKAQLLIDAVDPVSDSRERMLRIRRELDQPRRRFAALRRLPALALATLVVLFGASAFAAVRILVERLAPATAPAVQSRAPAGGRHSRAHPLAQQGAPAAQLEAPAAAGPNGPAPSAPPSSAGAVKAGPTTPPPSSDSQAPTVATEPGHEPALAGPASPAVGGTAPALPAHHTEPRVHGKTRPRVAAPAAPAAVNDSELVHRALKALRRDHDPALAARLLVENRSRNPDGPLAEEALSLQIEAASALRDPKARDYAREYLDHYPHGRYLNVARRALGEGSGL